MLPVLMILSLYYLWGKMDWLGQDTFDRIKEKNFGVFLLDMLFGTWFGDNSWSTATWTLSIELTATFFIYLLTQTVQKYRGR